MLTLATRNLRTRPARTLFTALAIALGVGMIFAMRIVGVAVEQTAGEARESRLAGADLEVVSASGANLDDALADELAARPEVEIAAPIYRGLEGAPDPNASIDLLSGASLKGTGLALLGVDPARALSAYELAAGSFFSSAKADEVLLPTSWAAPNGIGVGAPVRLTTGRQARDYTVVGLLKSETRESFTGRPTAWLPLATMQATLDTPGAATAILIRLKSGTRPDPARDQLQDDLGSQYIVTSGSGGTHTSSFFVTLTQIALPFSSFAVLLTGSFLVYNAFAITLAERRREISQLRTLGMTRGQVLRQTLTEALIVALIGSGLGLLLGFVFGRGLMEIFIRLLQGGAIPAVPVPLDGALLALGAGVLVTLAVTFNLARRAGRVSPLEGLRAEYSAGEQLLARTLRRSWIGALVSAAIFVIAIAIGQGLFTEGGDPDAGIGLVFLAPFALASMTLFALPLGVRGALWLFERVIRWRSRSVGASARLAAGNIARHPARAVLTTATVTISLMLVVALSGISLVTNASAQGPMQPFFGDSDFLLVRTLPGAHFTQAASLPSLPPLSPELQADIEGLKTEADIISIASIHLPDYSSAGLDNAFATDPDLFRDNPNFIVREGSWVEADRYFAAGPALTLPEIAARRHGLHPGDSVELDTLEGTIPFKVALVGGPLPVVTNAVGEQYFHSHPTIFLIEARQGADKDALKTRIEDIARTHALLLVPDSQKFFADVIDTLSNTSLALFVGLTSLSGLVAALGIANTLIASVLERQRELGTLRALGMSRAHVRGLVVSEAGLLGLTGAVIGALAGLAMTFAFGVLVVNFARENGLPPFDPPLPWALAGATVVIGPVIAMLAALYPADRAANVNPAEAMRAEGAAGFLKPAARLGPTGVRGLILRMPLAAKLSAAIGLVFVLTIAALTAVRVNYERELLEDNVRAILARGFDFIASSAKDQWSVEISELTPETLAALQRQAGAQADALQAQFQSGQSPYEFGLKYYFVADEQDKVITSDRAEYIGRVLTDTVAFSGPAAVVRLTDWAGERVFEAALPVDNRAGKRLGSLRIGWPRTMKR